MSREWIEYRAADLDGDTLRMDLCDGYPQEEYGGLLAVTTTTGSERTAMYLNREQAEQLRDYLNDVLTPA